MMKYGTRKLWSLLDKIFYLKYIYKYLSDLDDIIMWPDIAIFIELFPYMRYQWILTNSQWLTFMAVFQNEYHM